MAASVAVFVAVTALTVTDGGVRARSTAAFAASADCGENCIPDVVRRYAPVVYLAPGEQYRPMTADRFLFGSKLVWAHDRACGDHTLAERGEVDAGRLGSGDYEHKAASVSLLRGKRCRDGGQVFHSNDHTRPGDSNDHEDEAENKTDDLAPGEGFYLDASDDLHTGDGAADEPVDAPAYYEYEPGRYITYWFLYGFNDIDPTRYVDGDSNSLTERSGSNEHEGDWEGISIRLDYSDNPTSVTYRAHDNLDCWISFRDVEKADETHPVGYSARGTHATYTTAGYHWANGGYPEVVGTGSRWQTADDLLDARAQPWFGFGGGWGENHDLVTSDLPVVGSVTAVPGPLGPSRYKSAEPIPDYLAEIPHCDVPTY